MLVTHDMATVQAFCDRAMLIHDGEQRFLGDPEEAALRYYRLNFDGRTTTRTTTRPMIGIADAWIESLDGGAWPTSRRATISASRRARGPPRPRGPALGLELLNVDDVSVFGFGTVLEDEDGVRSAIAAGERLRALGRDRRTGSCPAAIRSSCSVSRSRTQGDTALRDVRLLDFLVSGPTQCPG